MDRHRVEWLSWRVCSPASGLLQTAWTCRRGRYPGEFGGRAITLDVIAFITLACAFAIYALYAGAISVRDETAAHTTLGSARSADIAGGGLATASFAAMGFFLTPWLMRLGGYPAATTALVGVTVPMIAIFFSQRCWIMTRVQKAHGLGELLAVNYGSGLAGVAGAILGGTVVVLLAIVLKTAANLMTIMSAGTISEPTGIAIAAALVFLTGAPAGIRAAGQMARLHTLLVVIGAIGIIAMVVTQLGGWDETAAGLTRAARQLGWAGTGGRGGGNYNLALAVAGSFGPGETWNGMTILSVQITLAVTLLMVVWLPWTIATGDFRQIGRQALTGAAAGGLLLIALTLIVGMATLWIDRMGGAPAPIVPLPWREHGDIDIASLVAAITREYVWAEVVIGLGGGAALHAMALVLLGGAIGALRPLWMHRARATNEMRRAIAGSQIASGAIIIGAVLLLFTPSDMLLALNALVLALAPLAVVPLAAACWFPTLTGPSLIAGMIAGTLVATFETLLPVISTLSVHAAAAGIITTLLVAIVVSRVKPRDKRLPVRKAAADALDHVLSTTGEGRSASRPQFAILCALIWAFFAIGPGIVIGNDLFGAPNLPRARWDFPIPSIAVWQLLAWATGTALVWYFARGRGLGNLTRTQIDMISAYRSPMPAASKTDRSGEDR